MSDKKLEAFQMYYDGLDDFQKLNNVRATAWLFWFHGWDAGIAALETENAALRAQADKLAEALEEARVKVNSRAINLEDNDEFVLADEYHRVLKQIDAALDTARGA